MDINNIRNFAIIAHVDHGKSTLADRILEITNAIPKREMKNQILDTMDLERERGITIKLQPVSMVYTYSGKKYSLNLIDTPGHIDFFYEVSRSLRAVEGVLLLVDSTQGIQAQTLSVLEIAKALNLVIIPVLTKIDSSNSRLEETRNELVNLLGINGSSIIETSGKTGMGVDLLLEKIIKYIPSPKKTAGAASSALVFDFSYSVHNGITAYARIMSGEFKKNDALSFLGAKKNFKLKDIGILTPSKKPTDSLKEGMIGYITTGIKEPGIVLVGDTLAKQNENIIPFDGYEAPVSVIWASIYPEDTDNFPQFAGVLDELRLSDSSFIFEEERSTSLGKGFKCGFLGILHLEIITEMIRRKGEFEIIITSPTTDYLITFLDGTQKIISTAANFPSKHEYKEIKELWAEVSVITPDEYIGGVSNLFVDFEGFITEIKDFENTRKIILGEIPLRELMRNFVDKIKSISSGYASVSYFKSDFRPANVGRLDILLAGDVFPAFSVVISNKKAQKDAQSMVEIIYNTLPKTMFVIKIQAIFNGKIIASRTLSALRKDVTAKLYGGDVTRKMKLKEKQKKGKKLRSAHSAVKVSNKVFLKLMKNRGAN